MLSFSPYENIYFILFRRYRKREEFWLMFKLKIQNLIETFN